MLAIEKRKNLLKLAIETAINAGEEMMKIYNSDDYDIEIKSDNTPVTIADKKANDLICKNLSKEKIPIISEESPIIDYEIRKHWEYVWIVDPIDGTKEFIDKNGEFTVNIGLIHQSEPILGVIYLPASKIIYFSDIELGAYKHFVNEPKLSIDDFIRKSQKLPFNNQRDEYIILVSRSSISSSTKNYIKKLTKEKENVRLVRKGSSLKLCLIAEQTADLYVRIAPIYEWDLAAGTAIINATGGKVFTADNQLLKFNRETLVRSSCIAKKID